jgi:two-component system, response regulator PdtaR
MRQLMLESSDAKQRLADRALVERAKGRLQTERGMTEDEAFRLDAPYGHERPKHAGSCG